MLMILISLVRHDINEARHHLTEFEMKDLGETKLCLSLQLECFSSGMCG
jgi:hypothetical protein